MLISPFSFNDPRKLKSTPCSCLNPNPNFPSGKSLKSFSYCCTRTKPYLSKEKGPTFIESYTGVPRTFPSSSSISNSFGIISHVALFLGSNLFTLYVIFTEGNQVSDVVVSTCTSNGCL